MSIIIRYFPCRGRVEPLRMLFEEVGVAYRENPFTDLGSWQSEKPKTPFGSLPIITDNGVEYTQTMALYRHYGAKYNMFGSTEAKRLRADSMIEAVYDVMDKTAGKLLWNPKWEEEKPKIVDGLMPTLYSNIQRYFEKENPGPWVLGDELSIADMYLWCYLDLMRPFAADFLKDFSTLQAFYDNFKAREKINSYLHSDRRWKTHTISMAPYCGTPETSSQP